MNTYKEQIDKVKNLLLLTGVKKINLNGQDVVIITEAVYRTIIELLTEDLTPQKE